VITREELGESNRAHGHRSVASQQGDQVYQTASRSDDHDGVSSVVARTAHSGSVARVQSVSQDSCNAPPLFRQRERFSAPLSRLEPLDREAGRDLTIESCPRPTGNKPHAEVRKPKVAGFSVPHHSAMIARCLCRAREETRRPHKDLVQASCASECAELFGDGVQAGAILDERPDATTD
jgi:hypothetical protein